MWFQWMPAVTVLSTPLDPLVLTQYLFRHISGETSITNQEQISDFSLDSMAADLLEAMVQLRHQVFGDMKQVVLEWILVGHR